MSSYVQGFLSTVVGRTRVAILLPSLVSTALAAALLLLLGWRHSGDWLAALAGFLLFCYSPWVVVLARTGFNAALLLPVLACGVVILAEQQHRRPSPWLAAGLGATAATALYTYTLGRIAAVLLLAMYALGLLLQRDPPADQSTTSSAPRRRHPRAFACVAAMVASFLALATPMFVYVARNWGAYWGRVNNLLESNIQENLGFLVDSIWSRTAPLETQMNEWSFSNVDLPLVPQPVFGIAMAAGFVVCLLGGGFERVLLGGWLASAAAAVLAPPSYPRLGMFLWLSSAVALWGLAGIARLAARFSIPRAAAPVAAIVFVGWFAFGILFSQQARQSGLLSPNRGTVASWSLLGEVIRRELLTTNALVLVNNSLLARDQAFLWKPLRDDPHLETRDQLRVAFTNIPIEHLDSAQGASFIERVLTQRAFWPEPVDASHVLVVFDSEAFPRTDLSRLLTGRKGADLRRLSTDTKADDAAGVSLWMFRLHWEEADELIALLTEGESRTTAAGESDSGGRSGERSAEPERDGLAEAPV